MPLAFSSAGLGVNFRARICSLRRFQSDRVKARPIPAPKTLRTQTRPTRAPQGLRAHDATGWQVPSTGPAARHHVCRPPPSRPKSYACHRPSGAVLYALGRPARKTRTRGGEERSKWKRGSFLPASPATSAAHAMPRASSERRMKAMARSHRRDGTGTGAQRVQRHSRRSAPGSAPASTNVPLTHRCAPCSAARSLHSGMDFPHRSRHPPHDDDEAVAPHTARPEAASAPPPDQQFIAYSRHPPSPPLPPRFQRAWAPLFPSRPPNEASSRSPDAPVRLRRRAPLGYKSDATGPLSRLSTITQREVR